MAYQKLTESLRSKIVRKVVSDQFDPIFDAIKERKMDLAHEIYLDEFKSRLEQIEALPEGWLPTLTSIGVNFGGQYHDLSLRTKVRVPASYYDDYFDRNVNEFIYEASHRFSKAMAEIVNDEKDAKERRDTAKTQTRAILNSYPSVQRLIEAWPEIEPYTVADGRVVVENLPAIKIDEINALLGLPKT